MALLIKCFHRGFTQHIERKAMGLTMILVQSNTWQPIKQAINSVTMNAFVSTSQGPPNPATILHPK